MDLVPDIWGGISFSGSNLAYLIFFLVAAFAAVISVVLFFHWRRYGMGGKVLALTEIAYLVVSAALISAAFLAIN